MRKVDIVSRKRVLDDFFKVEEARLRFERFDGTMSETVRRLSFERGDAAAALLVDARRRMVLLIEQFMYPTLEKAGGWLETVVAGMIAMVSARMSAGGGLASENEDIRLVERPVDDFLARVRGGEVQDAKTLIAGYWLADNLAEVLRG
jgi:hypothetical protein